MNSRCCGSGLNRRLLILWAAAEGSVKDTGVKVKDKTLKANIL